MKRAIFEATVVLEASADEVFAFHADPANIQRISPTWQKVRVLEGSGQARADAGFTIDVTMAGVARLRWTGRWQEVRAGELLVDVGLAAGPFAQWEHHHIFRALGPRQTQMTDRVFYRLRGGWLGAAISGNIGKLALGRMFADRHRRTRAVFSPLASQSAEVKMGVPRR